MEHLLEFFHPTNYRLTLNINKQAELVQGQVTITGEQLSRVIKLHAEGLRISKIKATIDQKPIDFTLRNSILSFTPLPLKKQRTISLSFSYPLKRNMEGVYLSTYQHEGREERIVTTQFESHYARQAFPCIDEPAAKATFDLKIITPDLNDTVLSNMPVKSEKILEYQTVDHEFNLNQTVKKKIVEFETTPPMSTYLLAFVLGRFHSHQTKTKTGLTITTYAALNQNPKMLPYPSKVAAAAIDYYNQLFGIDYPLPKLDQVALPDFEAGAMENWGLITYRESCLLADQTSAYDTKETVALVITHELSHQWFGNLVTMRWWDELWLNESFATIMEYLATDHIFPEYQIFNQFFTSDCVAALRRDAIAGVQSVHQPITDPVEIPALFDPAIVYAKGARLMFMLLRLMGEKAFFSGLRDYFKQFKYQNTVGSNLWASLQPYADFDVEEFMTSWLSKPGYPVITAGRPTRFLLDGSTDDSKWPLPAAHDDMSGHFIINLAEDELQSKLANFTKLTIEQKLRLVIDRNLLARTPLVSSATLLDLLTKLQSEHNPALWQVTADLVSSLKLFFPDKATDTKLFKAFLINTISPLLDQIDYLPSSTESTDLTKLRPILLSLAIYARHQPTIHKLSSFYQADYTSLPVTIRHLIFRARLLVTQGSILSDLLAAYQKTSCPELKSDLLAAFTSVETPAECQTVLELLSSPEVIRPQDHPALLSYLLHNQSTKPEALHWLYTHWDYIKTISGDKSLDTYVRIAASSVHNSSESLNFNDFFDSLLSNPALKRSIIIAKADIKARLALIKSDQKAVKNRLLELHRP